METDEFRALRYIPSMMDQWLKEALEHADMSQSELARQLSSRFNWVGDRSTINKMTLRKRGIEAAEIIQIAEITGYPLPKDDSREMRPGVREVMVAAHIQAGVWTETWEWEEADRYPVYIPDDPVYQPFRLYGAEARGPSMNKRYPEGTVLVFAHVEETKEDPKPGKRYVVERRRPGGETEHTVKLLHLDQEGKYWLIPESDDPRFQAPISIEEGTGDEDTVAIIGRVCFAVTRE